MSQNIHRQKLFGGRHTAEEVHQRYAFPVNAKCSGCGARPLTRALVMMEIKEAMKNPAVQAIAEIGPNELMPHIVQIKDSTGATKPYFRVSVVYACKQCTPQMEKQLAKAPSHCIVEINRGPGVDKVITSGRRS